MSYKKILALEAEIKVRNINEERRLMILQRMKDKLESKPVPVKITKIYNVNGSKICNVCGSIDTKLLYVKITKGKSRRVGYVCFSCNPNRIYINHKLFWGAKNCMIFERVNK